MTRAHRHDWGRQTPEPDRHLAVADEPPDGEVADREPTHRIVASDRQDEDRQDDPPPSRMAEMLDGFRFMAQATDALAYARDGAYSIQVDGWWRTANIWYAYWVAVPGIILCEAVKWALFQRLSRTLTALVVLPLALILLNGLPVIAWLIPDWADFTTWWTPAAKPVAVG